MSKPNAQAMPVEVCLAHLSQHIKKAHFGSSSSVMKVALDGFIANHTKPEIYMPMVNIAFTPMAPPPPTTPAPKKAALTLVSNVHNLPRRTV